MVPLAPLPAPPTSPSAPPGNRRRGFLVTLVLVLLALASAFLLWQINEGWENSYAVYGPTADNVRQTRQAMTQAFLLQVRRREDRAFNGPSVEALLDKAALKLSDAIAGESSLLGIAGHPPEGVLLKQLQEYQRVIFDLDQNLRRSLIAPRDATRSLSEETLVIQLRLFYEADRLGEQIETELTHGLARAVGNRLQEHRTEIAVWGAVLLGALALVARLGRVGMAMARQERLIQAILDSTSDGVFVKDPQGRYRMTNRAIAAMIGHAPGEILGHTDDDLFPAATAQAMQRSDAEVMRERKLASFETIFVDPDGQRRTVWTTKGPLADDWGKIAGVYGISRDVTERKNAEQRLREREDQLQAIIDNINEGVVTFSLDGKVLSWNRAALAMHEFPPSASTTGDLEIFFELYELLDTNGTLLPPSEWPMSRIIRGEHLRDLEFTSRRRDGTWSRTFSCGGRLVMSAEGSPVMGVLSLADISERKRVETELRTSEARFKLFMDNSPSIAWIKDSAGRHVYCSRPFLKRLNLGSDDWQGRTNEELFPGEIGTDLSRTDHLVLARGHALETDERTVGPDGEELYWRSIKFPFQDATGDWFVGGMALDVTERRRAEDAQTRSDEVARERAEELEAVMQAAPLAILLSRDPSCREILGNRTANLLFDAAEGENLATLTTGRSYRRAGQDLALDDLPMQQAVTQRREITIDDLEVTLPGGRPLLLMGGAAPLLGRNGQMRGAVGAFLDVTRQRQASEALEESNLRFSRIFHSNPLAISLATPEGRLVDVNPAWEALFGHAKPEVLGQKSLDLSLYLTPSDREELVGPVLRGDTVRNLEISFHRRDGGTFTGLCSTDLVHLEGQPLLLAMIADITEIKDAERELDRYRRHLESLVEERTRDLVAAEAQAQLILESSAGGLVGVDVRGLITFINPVACTLLETTAHTALGQSLHALIHGRRADGCGAFPAEDCPLLAALRDGRASEGREDVFWTAQSHRLTVLYATRPLIHGDEIKGAVLSFMDIGERKAMEESLRSTRTDLQVVLDTMPSLVAYWNPDFTNRFANGGFKTWLGLEPTSMTGRTLLDILGEECQRNTQPYIERGLNGETSSYETTLLHQGTGELRFVRKSFLPDWEGDTVRGVLAVIDDVTTLKEAERQADAARIEAERLARIRSEFLANMSHEIRTPMNVILGFANLLDRASLGPEERDLVRKLRQAGHSLLGIINDILDFSRIEAGRLTIDVVSFSLAEVLGRIATIMAAAVGTKPIELILEPPPPDADILEGDPLRLEQVLVNLVSNALKFTAEGSVSVGTRPVESSLGMIRLRFSVRDTGIGIPFAKQAEIFSAFAQADGSTTRHYGGSGLGLSISKRLVELMGGTIGVVSAPHAGSEFWIEVPFGRGAAPPASLPAPVQHLLIVEDHPQARAALVASAESLGWSADSVARGQEALARANAAVLAGTPFEVIILDAAIPNEDALATCRALRELLGPVALVLLLPAGAQPCVFARAHGPDSSLSKPVTPASLRDAVREALRRQNGGDQGTEASAPDPSARLVGKRLLVVDDSEINLDVARLILQAEGAEVVVANDGREALEKLRTMGDSVDVVLMDVQMPGQDGYETTRRLRSDLGLVALPVVALSAGALPTERDAALAAGMTGFLAKPFEIDDLVATILTLSCCGKDTLRLVPPPSAALDPGRGLRLWGDLGAYRTALRRFCDEYADAGRRMASHLAQGRAEEAATLAHRLKGTAGSLALERLEREAARVGDALKTPVTPPPLDPLADALDDALTAIAAFTEPGSQKPKNGP